VARNVAATESQRSDVLTRRGYAGYWTVSVSWTTSLVTHPALVALSQYV
jgi:hypothetical protein